MRCKRRIVCVLVWWLWLDGDLAAHAEDWSLTRPVRARPDTKEPAAGSPNPESRLVGQVDALLEQGDVAGARSAFEALVGGSRELARLRLWPDALARYGFHAQAAETLLVLARSKRELLRDAAVQQLAAGDAQAALATLARATVGANLAQRAELLALTEEAHRKAGTLSALAERLDGSRQARDRLRAARLWEEQGDDPRMEASLRAWLVRSPRDVRSLRALARLLERNGRRAEAIVVLETLNRLSPSDILGLEAHARLLRAEGRDAEAGSLLERAALNAPPARKPQLADLLGRFGHPELRRKLLQHLVRVGPNEAEHIVALGELELEEGNREAALRTWRGLLSRASSRLVGLVELSEVLADHGLVEDALGALEEALAISPNDLGLRRTHASLLERTGDGPAAERAWEVVLLQAGGDLVAQREARAHLVSLWKRLGSIPMRARMLVERVQKGPDVAASRLLAELFARSPERAEHELPLLDGLAAGNQDDADVLLALSALHARRNDASRALPLLSRLAEVSPEAAVDHLERAVDLAHAHYRDDDALFFARRAVALRPADDRAHFLLGRVHLRRRELAQAAAAFHRVVSLTPSASAPRMELAELALANGELSAAAEQWLAVLARADDDELASTAARRLMQLPAELLAGRLEQALLAGVAAHPTRVVFRRLLVAWYAHGNTGAMALRPVVSSLDDDDASVRITAIRLLGDRGAAGASLPLLARVGRSSSQHEAALLLTSVGRIAEPAAEAPLHALLARVESKLKPLVVWALLRVAPELANAVCTSLLADPEAGVRTMAALGVGAIPSSDPLTALTALLLSERHPAARAAALWALAQRLPRAPDSQTLFRDQVSAPPPVGPAALLGLREDPVQLASALFGASAAHRASAARLWRGNVGNPPLPPPSWPFDPRAYVTQVVRLSLPPPKPSALTAADGRVVGATLAALMVRSERGRGAALGAFATDGELLVPRALLREGLCPTAEFVAGFWAAAGDSVERLAGDMGSPHARAALVLLAGGGRAGHEAVASALAPDGSPERRSLLLSSLSAHSAVSPKLVARLQTLFDAAPDWPTRLEVAPLLPPDVSAPRRAREPVALVRAALGSPARARGLSCPEGQR